MSNAITQQTMRDILALGWTKGQVEAIANTVAKDATLHELYAFLHINKSYGLDPFKRESYFMKDKKTGRWAIIIGIDGMRKIARRDPSYLGVQAFAVREGDEFSVDAANYTVVHKFGKTRGKVLGAWARADAKGRMPVLVWVDFEEYYRPGWDAWTRMPATMITKVAESHALRRQFGLGDLYTEEEIGTSISSDKIGSEEQANGPVSAETDVFGAKDVFTDKEETRHTSGVPFIGSEVPQAGAEPARTVQPAGEEPKASASALRILRRLFRRKFPGTDLSEYLKEQAGVEEPGQLSKAACSSLIEKLQKLPNGKQETEPEKTPEAKRAATAEPGPKRERQPEPAPELEPGSEALFKLLDAGRICEFPSGEKHYTAKVSAVQPSVSGTFELYCPVEKVTMLDKARPNMHIAVTISKVKANKLLADSAVITEAA